MNNRWKLLYQLQHILYFVHTWIFWTSLILAKNVENITFLSTMNILYNASINTFYDDHVKMNTKNITDIWITKTYSLSTFLSLLSIFKYNAVDNTFLFLRNFTRLERERNASLFKLTMRQMHKIFLPIKHLGDLSPHLIHSFSSKLQHSLK